MLEIIALIVLILSLAGLGFMIYRKLPLLLELSETVSLARFNWREGLMKIKDRSLFKDFSFEIFLQKLLSKIRILTLKTDSKTSNWLQRLREKSRKDKFKESDNYWQEIKRKTKE